MLRGRSGSRSRDSSNSKRFLPGCFTKSKNMTRCTVIRTRHLQNGLGIKNLSLAVPHPTNLPKNLSLSPDLVRS